MNLADVPLELRESDHTYWRGGVCIPGVTSVLRVLDADMLARVRQEDLEYAQALGKAVHKCVELHCLRKLLVSSIDPVVLPYYRGWLKFLAETGFVVQRTEEKVYHPLHKYAGQLDLIGGLFNKLALIDVKSGSFWPSHGPQTAAYKGAFEAGTQSGMRIQSRYVLRLLDNGTYQLKEHTDPNDWAVFLACLTLNRYQHRS